MNKHFSGKRIAQDSKKLDNLLKREKRLNAIGLSLTSFTNGFNLSTYEQARKEVRAKKALEKKESA
jgi:hypothetical protein